MSNIIHFTTLPNGIQVRWFQCNPNDFEIRLLQNTSGTLDRPGTTASFFVNSGQRANTRIMTAFHWSGGRALHTGGGNNFLDRNNQVGSAASCMFVNPHAPSSPDMPSHEPRFANRAVNINALSPTPADIRWAIGGISLLLNENHANNTSMANRYLGQNGATAFYPGMLERYIPALRSGAARTFIGYNRSQNVIFYGIMSPSISGNTLTNGGATYHDMYTFLRIVGCNFGLSLDGGGSTRFRAPGGNTVHPAGDTRDIVCQLTHRGL